MTETAESYEFLHRRSTSRTMRIGREFKPPNHLDRDADGKDWTQIRPTENPFNIEEILDSLHRQDDDSFGKDLFTPAPKFVEPNYKIPGPKRPRPSPRGSSSSPNSGRAGNPAAGPRRDTEHVSFLAGIRILQNGRNTDKYSGYQVMRLATELVPAYAAILGKDSAG